VQRLDYPEFVIEVDRAKAAEMGLNQADVMRNVVAALNSSIQFNKKNFWIDPISHNQYFVGVQYPEGDIESVETLLNVPVTSPVQECRFASEHHQAAAHPHRGAGGNHAHEPLSHDRPHDGCRWSRSGARRRRSLRDCGIVRPGPGRARGVWTPFDPDSGDGAEKKLVTGSKIVLTGEYSRMQDTFSNLGIGLISASVLIYFLMVACSGLTWFRW
jgi:hypothetical protein